MYAVPRTYIEIIAVARGGKLQPTRIPIVARSPARHSFLFPRRQLQPAGQDTNPGGTAISRFKGHSLHYGRERRLVAIDTTRHLVTSAQELEY